MMLNGVLVLLGLVSTLMSVCSQEQAPTNFMVRQIEINRVRVSWTPPPNPPSRGYLITSDTRPTDFSAGIIASSTASSHDVGQVPGRVTYWLVALYGTPMVVGPVSGTVRDLNTPLNVTFSSLTSTSVTISWTQPQFSLPMDEYRVELRRVTGPKQLCTMVEDNKSKMTTGISTIEFTNLQEFSIYSVTITVTLPSGFSATLTPTVEFTTKAAAPTGSPHSISTTSTTSRSITVSWEKIKCIERNGPIINYTVEFQEVEGALITGVVVNRTFTATGLTPYTNYIFRVAGVNDNGTGPFTNVTSILSEEEVPDPVSNLAGTTKFTSILLTWSPPQEPNGVIISYEVTYTVNGNNTVRVNTSDLSTTFTIPSLIPQTRVSGITVTAYTRIGRGEPVNLPDQTTFEAPAKVMNVQVESVSDSSVRVSWEIINNPMITNYTVYYFLNVTEDHEAEVNESIIVSSSVNSVVIGNLTESNITDYQFQVAATAEINGEVIMGERSDALRSTMPPTTMLIATTTTIISTMASTLTQIGPIIGGIIGGTALLVVIVFRILLGFWLNKREDDNKRPPDSIIMMEEYTGPVIMDFPSNKHLTEGESVTFKTAVSGNPESTLTWYHEGIELKSDYAVEIRPSGVLSIVSAELKHSGIYKLQARNPSGTAEREVKLTVRPDNEEVDLVQKETVKLVPIPVTNFGEYVAVNHSHSDTGFRNQYESLDSGDEHPKAIGLFKENKKLNRFANITVYDHNHIVLNAIPGFDDCQGEFINACYIEGYSQPSKFIAAQGPKSCMLVDFWRLIWQERPPIIVMLTNIKEGNKVKCEQYWPDSGSKNYGPFKVTLVEYQMFADYVIRTLEVTLEGSSASWRLKQFHFTSWPDHCVPEYATSMLSFHRRILSQHKSRRGPMLVHCSAGVGRTGTFICIDIVLEQVKKENQVDIAGTINKLRHQRTKMVQTPEQYIFIHDAILESVMCGDTEINATNFRSTLMKMTRKNMEDNSTKLETQFKVLDLVSPKQSDVICTAALHHSDKNRLKDFLPSDKYRVVLSGEYPDYIHAVAANAYKQKKAYIIAEGPMSSTIRNMLKVICDRKCGAVIMLSDLIENGMESSCQYWPVEGVAQFGEFKVYLINQEELSGFTVRTLDILQNKTKKTHQVTQFHITCWRPDGVCSNLKSVMDVVEELSKIQRKTGNKPVFIHCSDTVTRSGMFCAIATIIDRCKTEGVVDVFQVVKALRVQKPGAVPTLANYKTLFDATLVFLDSFDTYANFQSI